MIAMASSAPATVPATVPAGEYVPMADRRIEMRVGWDGLQALLALRGDGFRPRITYLDGAVELMGASSDHERITAFIRSLVENFCVEREILVTPYGSWHISDKAVDAAAEPDGCWVFGPPHRKPRPDLAIEVVWTSGGLDKLEVYRRLGVPEVWFWRAGAFSVHVLENGRYATHSRSTCLPDIDLALICRLVNSESFNDAIRELRASLRPPP